MTEGQLSLIAKLAYINYRREAARLLASQLGTEDLCIFITDPEISLPLPAPGFPQTLPNGQAWQHLLLECRKSGRAQGKLSYPGFPDRTPVFMISGSDGTVLAFIGGSPEIGENVEIQVLLPLLAAAFHGEKMIITAEANAALARERASRAVLLAEALDRARRDLGAALAEARFAQNELKQADQRKDEFLAVLAHELRNPLAPIGNALQLLHIAGDNPAIVKEVCTIMDRQLQQMVRLIDDLMDVSRITRNKLTLRKERVLLQDILNQAMEAAHPWIVDHQHTVVADIPNDDIWINGDATRLTQIFVNLLTNAAKYTNPGGTLTLSVKEDKARAAIHVRDNGIGIEPQSLQKIFDMFSQADSSIGCSRGGLGIGLTLAKSLVEMHQGTVTAHSEGIGRGSEFIVRLPIIQIHPADPLAPISKQPAARAQKRYHILVVDDNKVSAQTMGWTVEALGHEARLAFDGQSALEAAKTYNPDIILLDIGLPGIDGYEVCRLIRRDANLQNALLIAQTGWGQQADRQRAYAAGFDHHLVKPVDIKVLKQLLTSFEKAR